MIERTSPKTTTQKIEPEVKEEVQVTEKVSTVNQVKDNLVLIESTTVSKRPETTTNVPMIKIEPMTESKIVIYKPSKNKNRVSTTQKPKPVVVVETTTAYNSEEDRKDTENAINQIIGSLQFDLNMISKVETTSKEPVEEATIYEKSEDLSIDNEVVSNVFVDNQLVVDEKDPVITNLPTTTEEIDVTTIQESQEPIAEKLDATTEKVATPSDFGFSSEIMQTINKLIEDHKMQTPQVDVQEDNKSMEKLNDILTQNTLKFGDLHVKAATVASNLNQVKKEVTTAHPITKDILSESLSSVLSQIYNEDPSLKKVETNKIDFSQLLSGPVELDSHEKFNQMESLSLRNDEISLSSEEDIATEQPEVSSTSTPDDKVEYYICP